MILLSLLSFVITFGLPGSEGHGHLVTPRSRNWLASQDGRWTNSQPGVPGAESCPHCLNKKGATELCGIGNGGNYDEWLDSTGIKMQWNSQATLQLGVPFEVQAFLDTNHAGHMELGLCKYSEATQTCLDDHRAHFVKDNDGYGIPVDNSYPDRAYFYPTGTKLFNFEFILPDTPKYRELIGSQVLMQFHYVTANSCHPEGYKDNSFLRDNGWLRSGGGLSDCVLPYDPTGARTTTSPEQFWNCAEITVEASFPTISPSPTLAPVTQSPTTPVPTDNPTTPVPTEEPTMPVPTPVVTPSPTSSTPQYYCNWSGCDGVVQGGEWCNESEERCVVGCGGGTWCSGTVNTNSPTNPPVDSPVNPPVASPTLPPVTLPPTTGGVATTTRYWDCSGGACGCAYLANDNPTHCNSNAMFDAPTNNPYGAKFYGTAAVSQILFDNENRNNLWLGPGCGKCWKVTGKANIPGVDESTISTLVLKGTNVCPGSGNPTWCGGDKVHFDISAPGFDFTAASQSNVCSAPEFGACEFWPNQQCSCDSFSDPILKSGCENFKSLSWNNPTVTYEEVTCPFELDRLNCWEENGNQYPFGIPDTCASNLYSGPTATPVTSAPTVATSAPTVATSAPTVATSAPTVATSAPTASITKGPTMAPTQAPTAAPSKSPTKSPTLPPSPAPTKSPTLPPSPAPTKSPTLPPTLAPTPAPVGGTKCCFDLQSKSCRTDWCGLAASNCGNCGHTVEWMVPDTSCRAMYSGCGGSASPGCCGSATCKQNGGSCPFNGSYCQCLP